MTSDQTSFDKSLTIGDRQVPIWEVPIDEVAEWPDEVKQDLLENLSYTGGEIPDPTRSLYSCGCVGLHRDDDGTETYVWMEFGTISEFQHNMVEHVYHVGGHPMWRPLFKALQGGDFDENTKRPGTVPPEARTDDSDSGDSGYGDNEVVRTDLRPEEDGAPDNGSNGESEES